MYILSGWHIKSFNNIWLTSRDCSTLLFYLLFQRVWACKCMCVSCVSTVHTQTNISLKQIAFLCLLARPVVSGDGIYWWKWLFSFLVPQSMLNKLEDLKNNIYDYMDLLNNAEKWQWNVDSNRLTWFEWFLWFVILLF